MAKQNASSKGPASVGKRWNEYYTPPSELEGLNGELAVNHFARRVSVAASRESTANKTSLPSTSQIEAVRAELTAFFATFFSEPQNQKVLDESRQFFHLKFDDRGIPQVPKSKDPVEWYEIRALLRSFGLLSRVQNGKVDLHATVRDNKKKSKKVEQRHQTLPSTKAAQVVQKLASAVTI